MKTFAVLGIAATSALSVAQTWSGSGGSLIDASGTAQGSFTSTINAVPGLTSVSSIALLGFHHTWMGDLIATVTAPGGMSQSLFLRVGRTTANALGSPFGDSSNFGSDDPTPLTGRDYVFVATGGGDLWAAATTATAGQGIAAGSYNATGALSGAPTGLFPGSFAAGNWTLEIADWAGGDTGALGTWEIRGTAVPEPATMAVLGLGAAALMRRRRARK